VDLEAKLRTLCGVLIATPQFQLGGVVASDGQGTPSWPPAKRRAKRAALGSTKRGNLSRFPTSCAASPEPCERPGRPFAATAGHDQYWTAPVLQESSCPRHVALDLPNDQRFHSQAPSLSRRGKSRVAYSATRVPVGSGCEREAQLELTERRRSSLGPLAGRVIGGDFERDRAQPPGDSRQRVPSAGSPGVSIDTRLRLRCQRGRCRDRRKSEIHVRWERRSAHRVVSPFGAVSIRMPASENARKMES
jgi:hypothetical protein